MPKIETSVYEIFLDGSENLVPSKVNPTGGDSDIKMEGIVFDLAIPLDPTALKIEADDIFAALERSARDEVDKEVFRRLWNDPASTADLVTEHRAGHFRVKCRIVDGTRVLGIGSVELHVLFDGRFSDRYLEMIGSK